MEIKARIELPLLLKEFNLPMIAVEIGVGGGCNSVDFLKAGIEKIYCVDSWQYLNQHGDGRYPQEWHDKNYELTLQLLEPYENKYVILRGKSSEMHFRIPDNSLGLVYIDGDHSFESVKADIQNYSPKLVNSGIIGFHDFGNENYGVNAAVKDFAQSNDLIIHDIPETGIGDCGAWIQINK